MYTLPSQAGIPGIICPSQAGIPGIICPTTPGKGDIHSLGQTFARETLFFARVIDYFCLCHESLSLNASRYV